MCGIAGFYSLKQNFSEQQLRKMTDVMVHRGPDASGYYYNKHVGLGHRRLSIIDLSTQANQPMYSPCGRYVIVYNGEVYNFQEIKKEILDEKDVPFFTSSDTEVILQAFIRWGTDFVQKLNGMFAIAIFDKNKNELFLTRDRLGIKPLFYYYKNDVFAFASELKALLQIEAVSSNATINTIAVNEFLHLGYIPQPHTIYQNIFKFPSGYSANVSEKGFLVTKYWSPEEKISQPADLSFSEAKNQLKSLLESSVSYRMICDVPFGTFLSGGTDSSVVTAMAAKISDKKINTFSIGFKESKYDESKFAANVAANLGTTHHEFIVSENEAAALIPELLDVFDEPFADSSAFPTMLVSKLARQHVTMTLSGDGGDELFMGYGAYQWSRRLNNPMIRALNPLLYQALSAMGNRYKRAAHLFDYRDYSKIKSHIFSQEQYLFKYNELSKVLNPEVFHDFILDENFSLPHLHAEEQQALFDLKYYLKDDLLVKVDRATMKYSLETRVPLLDYRVVEFALNLPLNFKINHGIQKYILKEVLYDYIPRELFHRPKWGFSIPLQIWLQDKLKYLADDYLSPEKISAYGLLNQEYVKELLFRFYNKKETYLYNRLWALIVLQQFAEKR
jgi:asparagine synthase (glutamine-hydrolysing)